MFNIKLIIVVSLLSSLAFGDAQEGKEMFDEAKCMECHNVEDFGGKDSKVKNYQHIKNSVSACQLANNAEWFDEDVESVSDHLNKHYYKLKK